MRQARHVLAAVVVATALCADGASASARDRAAAPMPAHRAPVAQLARSLASRLTSNLRQAVSPAGLKPDRHLGEDLAPPPALMPAQPAVLHASSCSPFRFRLPPPAV